MRLIELAIPLRRPFVNARGPVPERRLVLVGITEAGVTGWGEAAPYPGVTAEDVDDVWNALRAAGIRGTREEGTTLPATAAAAIDQARHDLAARLEGVPLRTYLGGSSRPARACAAIGLQSSPAATVQRVGRVIEAGIQEVKVKIEPGRDLEHLRAVRGCYPNLRLAADANGSYRADDPLFDTVDNLGLVYVEQPLPGPDLAGHLSLRNRLETPICLDESAVTEGATIKALELGAAGIVSLKAGLLGPTSVRRLTDRADEAGVLVKIGGLVETSVGRAHALALCGWPSVRFSDLTPPRLHLEGDVSSHRWTLTSGHFHPFKRQGLGIDIDSQRMSVRTRREARIP